MAMRRRRASRSPAIARSAMPNGCGGEYVEAFPEDLEPCMSPRDDRAFRGLGERSNPSGGPPQAASNARAVSSMFGRASSVTASGSSAQRSTETGFVVVNAWNSAAIKLFAPPGLAIPCDAVGEPRSAFEQKADEGHAISYFRHWHLTDVSFFSECPLRARSGRLSSK